MTSDDLESFARVLDAEMRANAAWREHWISLFTITAEDVARYAAQSEAADLSRWLDDGGR